MVVRSDNSDAGQVILALEYPYINGALREAGFFDPGTKRGLWLSSNFADRRRSWNPGNDIVRLATRGELHYKDTTNVVGNAKQTARLLALVARNKLFDDNATECGEMFEMLRKNGVAGATNSPIRNAVDDANPAPHNPKKWWSKLGIGDPGTATPQLNGLHDCALIERDKTVGTTLRYVLVFVGGLQPQAGPIGPEDVVWQEFVQIYDGGISSMH